MAGRNQADPVAPKPFATTKHKRPPEGWPLVSYIHSLIAVDNDRTTVAVSVVITVPPDDHCFVTTSVDPIVFTVAIAIIVTTTFIHGHSARTYTDSNFFCSNWTCAAD